MPHHDPPYKAEELNGYWIRKPDGSLSQTGTYLTELLKNAGGTLEVEMKSLPIAALAGLLATMAAPAALPFRI